MIIFLITLFLFTATFLIAYPNFKFQNGVLILLGVVLIITAGFRGEGVTLDYSDYLHAYEVMNTESRMEPSFHFIVYIVHQVFDNPVFLFVIYALLGVIIKLLAVKQLTNLYLLSSLIYLSHFFILHEMTQIRAGVAAGILLLCVKPIYNRKLGLFLLFTLIAITFHYSAVIILSLWFFNPHAFNKKKYLFIFVISYGMAYAGYTFGYLAGLIPIKEVQNLFSMYQQGMDNQIGVNINLFNAVQLFRIVMVGFFLYFFDKIRINNQYFMLLMKIYLYSICTLALLSDIPALAFRFSELLGIVEVVLIPLLVYVFRQKVLSYLFPIVIGFSFLCLNIFYAQLIFK